MILEQETICAIATGNSTSAISVIRISGEQALTIVKKIFTPAKKQADWWNKPYNLVYGTIHNNNTHIDSVLVSVFVAPFSYTGENTIEISCHGSVYIQNEIITLLLTNGARLAKPGEFTQRAYLNGKLDLSQAEAVADLISSSSRAEHRLAVSQMKGGYAIELQNLRAKLLHFTSMLELELDFAEEDVEFADRTKLKTLSHEIYSKIYNLVSSFSVGNVIKKGVPVCIIGEPNVGKSTLLNTILHEDKAIISDIPGTTRDVIEDTIIIGGTNFRFIDTAGIRTTTDTIEQLGINKTFSKIESASIVLFLVDVSSPLEYIKKTIQSIKQHIIENQKFIIVVNKIDLITETELQEQYSKENFEYLSGNDDIIFISAKKDLHVDNLINALLSVVNYSSISENDAIITNARHHECLQNALTAITNVQVALENNTPNDLISIELRHTLHYIGEITGSITNDETLGYIFKHFCIGK